MALYKDQDLRGCQEICLIKWKHGTHHYLWFPLHLKLHYLTVVSLLMDFKTSTNPNNIRTSKRIILINLWSLCVCAFFSKFASCQNWPTLFLIMEWCKESGCLWPVRAVRRMKTPCCKQWTGIKQRVSKYENRVLDTLNIPVYDWLVNAQCWEVEPFI